MSVIKKKKKLLDGKHVVVLSTQYIYIFFNLGWGTPSTEYILGGAGNGFQPRAVQYVYGKVRLHKALL